MDKSQVKFLREMALKERDQQFAAMDTRPAEEQIKDLRGYIAAINSDVPEPLRHGLLAVSMRNVVADLAVKDQKISDLYDTIRAIAVGGLGLRDPLAEDCPDMIPPEWNGLLSEKVAAQRNALRSARVALKEAYEILDAPDPESDDRPRSKDELCDMACKRLDAAKSKILDSIALGAPAADPAMESSAKVQQLAVALGPNRKTSTIFKKPTKKDHIGQAVFLALAIGSAYMGYAFEAAFLGALTGGLITIHIVAWFENHR